MICLVMACPSGDGRDQKSFAHYQSVLFQCLNLIKTKCRPLFAIGQSTGAAVLIDYYLSLRHSGKWGFRQVILLAPLGKARRLETAVVTHTLVEALLSTWKRVQRNNSSDNRFIRFFETLH